MIDATTTSSVSTDTRVSVNPAAAEASSAHSRINVPLNLQNWAKLPQGQQDELAWFHQHILDTHLDWKDAGVAVGYDASTVFRVLKGTYEGSWSNVCSAIESYRRLVLERGSVQSAEFAKNRISEIIWGALNYALANNTITLIEGESRLGKTVSAQAWRDANNHGRSVFVMAPEYGGTKRLLRDIAQAVGVNRSQPLPQIHEALIRAFNKHRILIIDEAHRLLPGDRRSNPVNLELIRGLHDRTGCAIALIATTRFHAELTKLDYMFEQLLGRIELPVRIKGQLGRRDIRAIVEQFIGNPSVEVMDAALKIANERGRLGVLVGNLKVASRLSGAKRGKVPNSAFFKAIKMRDNLMAGLPLGDPAAD